MHRLISAFLPCILITFAVPAAATEVPGDLNCDGVADVLDVQLGIYYALGLPISPNLDADSDNQVDACAGVLRIYLTTNGTDANSGIEIDAPILTLERAEEIIASLPFARDVEVRIAPGTYYGQTAVWTTTFPNNTITFMPMNDDKNRPVFHACDEDNPADCGHTFFRLAISTGAPTNVVFHYIRVEYYRTAISLHGSGSSEDGWNGYNTIYGCYFYKIGNKYNSSSSGGEAYAVVRLQNSRHNLVQNNHFIYNENSTNGGWLHGIYVAHWASNNLIKSNSFKFHSGDAVRFRNESNFNEVRNNDFVNTGTYGYSEWYDYEGTSGPFTSNPECPSWENIFYDNTLDGAYDCDPMGTWVIYIDVDGNGSYSQSGDDNPIQCTNSAPFSGAKRVKTYNNQKVTPPCSNM